MAIESVKYTTYAQAVFIHLRLMKLLGETRFGVDHRSLIESALARPQQAAIYENADLIRQAATLYFGLIKNHPWLGGNKRTATAIVNDFLYRNGYEIHASNSGIVKLVLEIEADEFDIGEIEEWLRERTFSISN
ncbi:MAG: type II toxin-antitoxin system death-on-curing family toxin [Pyrinomonadaceae bacterium]|nr:type II toxin-antitoxin system death-on-curing family toxin [Pyrinomonadaceae bacterium]